MVPGLLVIEPKFRILFTSVASGGCYSYLRSHNPPTKCSFDFISDDLQPEIMRLSKLTPLGAQATLNALREMGSARHLEAVRAFRARYQSRSPDGGKTGGKRTEPPSRAGRGGHDPASFTGFLRCRGNELKATIGLYGKDTHLAQGTRNRR